MAAGLVTLRSRGRVRVRSAGSDPAEVVDPLAVEAMAELGVDLSDALPKALTEEAVRAADVVVTMGCGDACPIYPGKRYEDWQVDDPAEASTLDEVRAIRHDIDTRVQRLLAELPSPKPDAFEIAIDDPRRDDVRSLLEQHLAFAREVTPPGHVHALDRDALLDARITMFSLRDDGELLGVAALKQLDPEHVEVKSMHTALAARRRGVGRALLDHLLSVAAERGARRVSLETGAGEAFAPARALYASAGFVSCGPFGDYEPSPLSAFMTRSLP